MSQYKTTPSKRDVKMKRALEIFYSNYGTGEELSLSDAAYRVGADEAGIILEFMPRHRIGYPSDRGEALKYLKRLEISLTTP